MAKTPPAPAAAPVLDDPVDLPGEGEAAPRRFKLRLPRLSLRLPAFLKKLPIPKIALSKKMLLIVGASVLGLAGVGGATYAFWPAEPEWPRTPVPKKIKRAKAAASAPAAAVPAAAASAASQPPVASEAASAPVEAQAAASAPEDPMDKLRRRLGETLGSSGKLQADGPGELRVTTRGAPDPAAPRAAKPSTPRNAARHAGDLAHGPHGGSPGTPHHSSGGTRAARLTAAASMAHVHWSYEGLGGPDAWGRLKPEFARCASGTRQSPIDIRDGIPVQLEPIRFAYQASRFGVIDNGHTVQVNVAPGNFIETLGRRFELLQFHFHRPSEERIDGRQFDMSAHLVHKDGEGRLAIVAVLLERGAAQSVVQAVWNNLPLEKGEEQSAPSLIDLNQLLPAERSYFTYMGSLTTPPCSEGVLWMVLKKPVPIAPEQLHVFSRLYPMNARPLQAASGRMIKESN